MEHHVVGIDQIIQDHLEPMEQLVLVVVVAVVFGQVQQLEGYLATCLEIEILMETEDMEVGVEVLEDMEEAFQEEDFQGDDLQVLQALALHQDLVEPQDVKYLFSFMIS